MVEQNLIKEFYIEQGYDTDLQYNFYYDEYAKIFKIYDKVNTLVEYAIS